MSLLQSERERSPRPKGGQYALMAGGPAFPVLKRWIPDRPIERLDGWLWQHQWIHFTLMVLIIGGLVGSLIYLVLAVARMTP